MTPKEIIEASEKESENIYEKCLENPTITWRKFVALAIEKHLHEKEALKQDLEFALDSRQPYCQYCRNKGFTHGKPCTVCYKGKLEAERKKVAELEDYTKTVWKTAHDQYRFDLKMELLKEQAYSERLAQAIHDYFGSEGLKRALEFYEYGKPKKNYKKDKKNDRK